MTEPHAEGNPHENSSGQPHDADSVNARQAEDGGLEAGAEDRAATPPPPGTAFTGSPVREDESVSATAVGVGSVIGPYRLLEQIGEGGMGIVFMAEQLRPVRRRVALKLIKPGLDGRQVVARFDAERQALALMDHPHIAKVFDAGAVAGGGPYFVMELVRGLPITDYCDQHRLPPPQRLALFAQVCHAVQHAHQKGVIHRDLKPGNVLVTLADDGATPVPRVIDFGVAKAVSGPRLTDRTLFTELCQVVGTPLYMSPEQAEMSSLLDVDTRSDVYALGVLLYELLTGTTPFDKARIAEAAYVEVLRIIREEDPPTPSTRLSSLGETLASVSALRQTEPRKLGCLIKGELDWIVMRALEKDRGRRYESASRMARDVERYLADDVVEARRPSAGYRLRKFIRRHRVGVLTVLTGTIACLAALGLLAAFLWTSHRRVVERGELLARVVEANAAREQERQRRSGIFEFVVPRGDGDGVGTQYDLRDLTYQGKSFKGQSAYNFRTDLREAAGLRARYDTPDLLFDGQGFNVQTVRGSRSRIIDLGERTFEQVPDQLPSQSGGHIAPAVAGHTYLVKVENVLAEFWVLLRVTSLTGGNRCTVDWIRLDAQAETPRPTLSNAAATRVEQLLKTARLWQYPEEVLKQPRVVLQIRVGHAGGNPCQMTMTGAVERINGDSPEPLAWGEPIGSHEPTTGYHLGGRIPLGKRFVVTRVTYRTYRGAADPHYQEGLDDERWGFRIRVGPLQLVNTKKGFETPTGVWDGRVELSPGQEDDVFVEASWFAAVDVVIEGELVDASTNGEPSPNVETRSHRYSLMNPSNVLKQPKVVLQLKVGHEGGNPRWVDMRGCTYRVEKLSDTALNLAEPPRGNGREDIAFCGGGRIPPGMVFVVNNIRYRSNLDETPARLGYFTLRIRDKVIVGQDQAARRLHALPPSGSWHGRVEISSGREREVVLEAGDSTAAEVTLEGEFVSVTSPVLPSTSTPATQPTAEYQETSTRHRS